MYFKFIQGILLFVKKIYQTQYSCNIQIILIYQNIVT
jgi:hypothetical protein